MIADFGRRKVCDDIRAEVCLVTREPAGHQHASAVEVTVLAADLELRVLTRDGELLRELTLDPTRDYQPRDDKPGPQKPPKMQ